MNEQIIPGYRIISLLGEGGFAKVYLAQHEMLGETVALKVMYPKLANDVVNCERFIREARTLAKLRNHESIVTVHDIAKAGDIYYMAMEYLSGPTLKEAMSQGTLQLPVIDIIKSLASALGYAHALNIVHRDVKPANIIFNEAGQPVLTDFGIAKLRGNTEHTLTQTAMVIGTMGYMAPEQFFGSDLDARSDLYALGILLFEMLSGKRPHFADESDYVKMLTLRMGSEVPTLPQQHLQWQPVIAKLLASSPDDRYTDAEQLIEHLDQVFPCQQAIPEIPEKSGSLIRNLAMTSSALVLFGVSYVVYDRVRSYDTGFCDLPVESNILSEAENAVVNRLLSMAKSHEEVGRVSAPPGANALEAYQAVLRYDPANRCALSSVERIDGL